MLLGTLLARRRARGTTGRTAIHLTKPRVSARGMRDWRFVRAGLWVLVAMLVIAYVAGLVASPILIGGR